MTNKQLKWLSYVTCLVIFFVTLGGNLVTKTDSGLGCGREWPLCHGQFVPAHTVASLIEYSHRAVSGFAGIAVLVTFLAFWRYSKDRRDLQIFSFLALFFVIVQAFMGALAVIKPQSALVLAFHFGFSLIAFASSVMLVFGARNKEKAQVNQDAHLPRISKGLRNFTWLVLIYSYIVVYIGAYVSHTYSAGACAGWPLCNGRIVPELTGSVAIAFIHRVAAMILFIGVAILAHFMYHNNHGNRELQVLSIAAVVLCLLQILSGAAIIFTLYDPERYIFAALAHNLIISLLFSVLSYLSVRAWQLNKK
ncbi:heme A synthase [Paenibacillus sediminis]|uniref:Cytochrome c oxidase assembly protein subunit 15 n=1 Tax=Paenibacillus sediminis TaxID=664909 RepID=A0ABS4H5Z5_9BACL|nr:heme A synthase [Paenibacillus sediminis]MBP1937936.1 cytochrome c oxidase assembly protein subunit 15 [Paenibacillus sediminis]